MLFKKIISTVLLCLISSWLFSQDIIWLEDFNSYTNGTNHLNLSSERWFTRAGNCDDNNAAPGNVDGNYWGVANGEFKVNDIEGLTCSCVSSPTAGGGDNDNFWYSESINVANYNSFTISMKGRAVGDMECASDGEGCNSADLLEGHFQLDNGTWTQFFSMCGAKDGASSSGCIQTGNANTLKIRVKVGTQANGESYYFDDIKVIATPNISGNDTLTQGKTHQYSINTTGGNWSSSNQAIATINSAGLLTAVSPGTTQISYITNSGCYISKQITIIPCIKPSISAIDNSRCGEGSVELKASTSEGRIDWFVSAVAGTKIHSGESYNTPAVNQTIVYFVESNTGTCISDRIRITATIYPQAYLTLVSSSETEKQTVQISEKIQDIVYQAHNNFNNIAVSVLPLGIDYKIENDIITIFGATDELGLHNYSIQTSGVCPSEIHQGEITVKKAFELPTIITPNQLDGVNDSFGFTDVNGSPLSEYFPNGYRITIFNKFGQIITEKENEGWDGSYQGKIADPGVYFFILSSINKNGSWEITQKASIELVY